MPFKINDPKTKQAQRKGGKNSPTNFKNNPELAKIAGSKGGKAEKKRDEKGRFIKKVIHRLAK